MMTQLNEAEFVRVDEGRFHQPSPTGEQAFTTLNDPTFEDSRGVSSAHFTHLEVSADQPFEAILPFLESIQAIRVIFDSFSDGRGFSLAKQLRLAGYKRELVARGHILADQYAKARSCGFDYVEIPVSLARRQPEHHWVNRSIVRESYQGRLMSPRLG